MDDELEEEVVDRLNVNLLVNKFIIFPPANLNDHPHRYPQEIVDNVPVLKQPLHSLTAYGL